MREKGVNRRGDEAIARVAARQHGVVSLTQLLAAGIDSNGVHRRLRAARLHRIHGAVYSVGHRGLSNEGRWMAAVLTCGADAVLSHRSAARTVADLTRTLSPTESRQAIREAEFRGLDLGTTATDRTRSELERAFLRLCRRHRLPEPEVNVRIAGFTADFVWREQRLVVETDGYRAHRGRQAFEDDRERELELGILGFRLRRVTDRRIRRRPGRVAAAVEAAPSREQAGRLTL